MNIELPWKIINKYFEDNKNLLVKHHLDSYNDFFNNGINASIHSNGADKFTSIVLSQLSLGYGYSWGKVTPALLINDNVSYFCSEQ